MKTKPFSMFLLLITIFLQGCVSQPQEQPKIEQFSSEQLVFVPFCELLENPEKYDNKIIETTGIFYFARESSFVYDPQCVNKNNLVWSDFDNNSSTAKLDPYLDEETSDEYKTVGVFRVKAAFSGLFQTKKDKGFGHLRSFNYFFKINEIKDIIPMSKDAPYPW